jgi:hypothetical protein
MDQGDAEMLVQECEKVLAPGFAELHDSAIVGGWSPEKAAQALLRLAIKNLREHASDADSALATAARAI